MATKNPRVVVVGGGMAGVSAAVYLVQNGFEDVTLLEASDRLGGRIHTVCFGEDEKCLVELGANWIHGGCLSNSVYALASKFGLLNYAPLLNRIDGHFYHSTGKCIPRDLCVTVWKHFQQWENEVEESQVAENTKITTVEKYVKDRFISLLNDSSEIPSDQHEFATCVFNCLWNYYKFHVGGYPDNMLVGDGIIDSYENIEGGNVKVPDGIATIIQKLQCLLPEAAVKFHKEVTEIRWQGNEEAPVTITCKGGEVYLADHVICTPSLAYLQKHHKTLFIPNLSKTKTNSISRMAMGKVNKIFLFFDKPFWASGNGSIKLAWDDEAKNKFTKNKSQRFQSIFAFDEVLNNPNVLCAWLSGDEAEQMETLSDLVVIENCTRLLREFLGNPSIPPPQKIMRSKWCTNPYFLGSYSYISMNSTPKDIETLAQPVYSGKVPRLLFAGEATSSNAYSTMHGARNSGLREAQRLQEMYIV